MNSVHFFFTATIWFSNWRKASCLQILKIFYGVTSFWRYPLYKLLLLWYQDDLCFLWDRGFWILTTWPSHSYTLAYCRPTHLIYVGFHSLDNNLGAPPKKHFKCPSIVTILQSMWPLWVRFFLQTIRMVKYKIFWLKIEKKITSFLSISYMQISTKLRPNIHQNSPEILGIKVWYLLRYSQSALLFGIKN
jgi:hypothetical protein